MARTNERLIGSFNALLKHCQTKEIGYELPSEAKLSEMFEVSRTTVRHALKMMSDAKLLEWEGRKKELTRVPSDPDFLSVPPSLKTAEELDLMFMDWLLRNDVPPGTPLNAAQLSKKFSVAPHTLKEFLFALSRFGLVERRARGGWVLNGFTREFAAELSDFRAVLELNAVRHLVGEPQHAKIWKQLDRLESEHEALLSEMDEKYHDFSRLDERFHQTINNVVKNRFAGEFQRVFSIIFYYHYQWNKSDERLRNEVGVHAHLRYIHALKSRDLHAALAAAKDHLSTAKKSLLRSMHADIDGSADQQELLAR